MIVDITGIELTPGDNGEYCLGNGEHLDESGNFIECCCDECGYLMCCLEEHDSDECKKCTDRDFQKNNIGKKER